MRVLLLGAGASRSADYPLAGDLLPSIETEAGASGSVQLRQAWSKWREFVDRQEGFLRLIVENPNPEITLSFLDLCEAAVESHDDEQLQRIAAILRSESTSHAATGAEYWDTESRKALRDAAGARERLLECLRHYFEFRHCKDVDAARYDSRSYLRRLLDRLKPGDVVVTLNWDTLVERTLLEAGRWNPMNGYGFKKKLCVGIAPSESGGRLKYARPSASEITVLKLHGSVGWYSKAGALYFNHPMYLQCLALPGHLPLVDPKQPSSGSGPPEGAVLAYPSFLKRLETPEIQDVWQHASRALQSASSVECWGYSLPESDTAVRTLLLPIRSRLKDRAISVAVHVCRDDAAKQRWRALLGSRAKVDDACL